jgi:hypothetical protein
VAKRLKEEMMDAEDMMEMKKGGMKMAKKGKLKHPMKVKPKKC